jgi:hypothetical protein
MRQNEFLTVKKPIPNFRYQPTAKGICSAFARDLLLIYSELQSIDWELHSSKQ